MADETVSNDEKLWAALSYIFAPIVGIIILLMEDKKKVAFLKFHAVQSIALSIVVFVVAMALTFVTLGLGGICAPALYLAFFYWAYLAYQGQMFNVPLLTDFLKKQGWA